MSASAQVSLGRWPHLLEQACYEVFEIMLASQLDPGKPVPCTGVEFTAMVGLAGSVTGILSVRCDQNAATKVASAMLHLPIEKAAEHAWDALGEVANMVAGNFKNKIEGVSDKCLLSVPTIITGADYSFHSQGNDSPFNFWFRFQGSPLQVTLEIQQ